MSIFIQNILSVSEHLSRVIVPKLIRQMMRHTLDVEQSIITMTERCYLKYARKKCDDVKTARI